MNASRRDEQPIDALSIDGLEHVLESGDMSPGVEMVPGDLGCDMWTVEDAIRQLGITRRTVLRKLKNGELTGYKISGPYGPEWRLNPCDHTGDTTGDPVTSERSPGVNHLVRINASVELLEELRKQLSELKAENQALSKELQGANWRNGYLESQAETKDQQIEAKEQQLKLLTDRQHKPIWWRRTWQWFIGISP